MSQLNRSQFAAARSFTALAANYNVIEVVPTVVPIHVIIGGDGLSQALVFYVRTDTTITSEGEDLIPEVLGPGSVGTATSRSGRTTTAPPPSGLRISTFAPFVFPHPILVLPGKRFVLQSATPSVATLPMVVWFEG